MLPNGKHLTLRWELVNSPTRLLAALLYIKIKRTFLNEGTQKEMGELFLVKAKQLSKVIMGRKYLGRKDKKGAVQLKR